MEYQSFDEFTDHLRSIRGRGYVQTHRAGDTGVGKTLEDLLGIAENNDETGDIRLGNGRTVELKAIRRDGTNPVTLFTKEPPRRERRLWNEAFVDKFGYLDDDGRHALYTTLAVGQPNPQGLYLSRNGPFVEVTHEERGRIARYPRSTLATKFEKKFPELVLVVTDARGKGRREWFWYSEAVHLTGFDERAFFHLLDAKAVTVDTRMHLKPDGTLRNHGTAWRIRKKHLPDLFSGQTNLLSEPVDFTKVRRIGQQLLSDYL